MISGRRLVVARLSKDLTLEEAGKRAGILPSTLGNYEQGIRGLRLPEAQRLGELYGEPPAYLMGAVDEADRDILKTPAAVRAQFLQFVKQLTK